MLLPWLQPTCHIENLGVLNLGQLILGCICVCHFEESPMLGREREREIRVAFWGTR